MGLGTKEQKQHQVEEAVSRIGRARAVILADYRGLDVGRMTELRRQLRSSAIEFRVIKNTCLARAFDELGIAGMDEYLAGPTVVAFGYDDPVTPARLLAQFAKDNKELRFKGGVVEGRAAAPELVQRLAELPPRSELLARLAGVLQSPLASLGRTLAAPLVGFVTVVAALERKRAAEAA